MGKCDIFISDIGTEELAHLEMVSTIVHQLTRNLSPDEIKASGFDKYYVDHTLGIWPQSAGGVPFSSAGFQSKGDPITDLHENLAAEQKARTTYDNILRLVKDPEVADPIRFLRAREIVHYQRFGEGLRLVQENLDSRNFYACNPAFDTSVQSNKEPCLAEPRTGQSHLMTC
ncbi:manganese catalase family protein [Lachnospiraceae bacterium ZAX-1]